MTSNRRTSYFHQMLVLSSVFFPTISASGIFGTLGSVFSGISQRTQEFICSHASCCEFNLKPAEWSSMDYKGNPLHESLQLKLFGQHLAKDVILHGISLHKSKPENSVLLLRIIEELEDHLQENIWSDPQAKYGKLIHEEYEKRKKLLGGALVLFIYGPTGTGKSFTSELIAESLYKKGLNSPLVHRFVGNTFISHERDQFKYELQFMNWIDGNITYCPHSMFIFDEFNELPVHLISMLLKSTSNTHYRDAIFMFIMNTGSFDTMEKMLALYEEGKVREDVKLEEVYSPDFRELLTYLVKKHVMDKCEEEMLMNGIPMNAIFAPFLPLEREHVTKCIIEQYINKGEVYPSADMIRSVQSSVKYGPVGKEKFSFSGCKPIYPLVTSALSRKHYLPKYEEL